MRCLSSAKDPRSAYRRYLRELVIAGMHGRGEGQRTFVRRYDRELAGTAWSFDCLPDEACSAAFGDALRAKRGQPPQTELGRALAYPPGFDGLVPRCQEAWWELEDYEPAGIALDPICEMLVDPATALPLRDREGCTHFFCCPRCRAHYLGG
jgi:YHS domain-containing protein